MTVVCCRAELFHPPPPFRYNSKMTHPAARAIARAVSPHCAEADGDFLRAQVRRIPPPLGWGARVLALMFSLSPSAARLRKWRNSPFAPLRDFAAMASALTRFAQHSRTETETETENESGE